MQNTIDPKLHRDRMQRSVSVPKGNAKKEGSKLQNNGARRLQNRKLDVPRTEAEAEISET